jgi:hypothetical protein
MIEARLTMAPPPREIMLRAAIREHKNTPVKLTATTLSQSASG